LVLAAEAAQLVLEGGELAVAGEGLVALVLDGLLPGAEQGFVDAEGAGRLGDRVALLGDELDRLGLELGGVGTPLSGHDGPPRVMIHA
jgi:hypothetical protein